MEEYLSGSVTARRRIGISFISGMRALMADIGDAPPAEGGDCDKVVAVMAEVGVDISC